MKPRIKICCISSLEEAKTAIHFGAHALGLVGPMPSGPGVIDNSLIKEIARHTPPPTATFLLTSETTAQGVIEHHRQVHTSTLQLVDAMEKGAFAAIRQALPTVKLVKVIHVLNEQSVEEALEVAEMVDALLLDSGNPNLGVKVLGGTGKVHNWAWSKAIVDQSRVPVFLAGGLNPENAKRALDEVGPFGLDICSGVRTAGMLDPLKLEAFMKAAGY